MLGLTGVQTFVVKAIRYEEHEKSRAPLGYPRTLRCTYELAFHPPISEFVCMEHQGYPRRRGERWWPRRSAWPMPATASEAVAIAAIGGLAQPISVDVLQPPGERYGRIIGVRLGPIPPYDPQHRPAMPWSPRRGPMPLTKASILGVLREAEAQQRADQAKRLKELESGR